MATAVLLYPFRRRWKRASDDENEKGFHSARQSRAHSRNTSRSSTISIVDQDYFSQAAEAWDSLWTLLHKDDWKLETGTDPIQGCVKSRYEKGVGKIFMLQGTVKTNAEKLWKELVFGINESPSWNPTLLESKTLQELDDDSCITYSVSAEAAGGIVSSRDFVNVLKWGKKEEYYLSSGMSTTHPDMPAQKKYVRGENGAGGWAMRPSQDDVNNSTELFWVSRTDLKGWLPQAVIDKAMSGFLLDFLKYLRKHMDNLQMGDHV